MASPLLILLGPPASGKGTQARYLEERFGWKAFSTGAAIRHHVAEGTPLGREARALLANGYLLPDDVILRLVAEELRDHRGGLLLDGFPRTLGQATAFDDLCADLGWRLDAVIALEGTADELVHRVASRLTCPACGAIYRAGTGPAAPELGSPCERCGTPLVRREDDRPEVFRERFAEYQRLTAPLVPYYDRRRLLHRISALLPIEAKQKILLELGTAFAPSHED